MRWNEPSRPIRSEPRSIDNLPNLTRNFTDSVFTLPGVSNSDAPRLQNPGYTGFLTSGFSIGGSNGRNNLVTFDGGENDYGSGQLRTPNVSVESVQEFQVNRNAFAAEFGFTAGTAVNVVTKSGTNDFHGSAYAFFRDQHTGARNYFDTSKRSRAGSELLARRHARRADCQGQTFLLHVLRIPQGGYSALQELSEYARRAGLERKSGAAQLRQLSLPLLAIRRCKASRDFSRRRWFR